MKKVLLILLLVFGIAEFANAKYCVYYNNSSSYYKYICSEPTYIKNSPIKPIVNNWEVCAYCPDDGLFYYFYFENKQDAISLCSLYKQFTALINKKISISKFDTISEDVSILILKEVQKARHFYSYADKNNNCKYCVIIKADNK